MNPQVDKVVKGTTMVATAVASYFLLTADYGPGPSVLDPIKERIISAQDSMKEFIFGSKKDQPENSTTNDTPTNDTPTNDNVK